MKMHSPFACPSSKSKAIGNSAAALNRTRAPKVLRDHSPEKYPGSRGSKLGLKGSFGMRGKTPPSPLVPSSTSKLLTFNRVGVGRCTLSSASTRRTAAAPSGRSCGFRASISRTSFCAITSALPVANPKAGISSSPRSNACRSKAPALSKGCRPTSSLNSSIPRAKTSVWRCRYGAC